MEGHHQNIGGAESPTESGARGYSQLRTNSPQSSHFPHQESYPGQGESAPEVAGCGSDLPEVVQNQFPYDNKFPPNSEAKAVYPTSGVNGTPYWGDATDTNKVVMPYGIPVESGKEMHQNWQQEVGSPEHYQALSQPSPPKNRRRLFLIAGVVAAVVIAIVVGVTAGVVVSRNNSKAAANTSNANGSSDGNTTTTITSKCNKAVCNQILSAATINSDVHLFARGSDDAIWGNVLTGGVEPQGWTSLGGQFRSQPASVAWNTNSPIINIFASAATGDNVATKNFTGGSWSTEWRAMSKISEGAVAACHVTGNSNDRADIFVRTYGATELPIVHDWWDTPQSLWADQSQGAWDLTEGGNAAGGPSVVCRESSAQHDVIIYDKSKGSVQHNQWNGTWKGWRDQGGNFVGDPVVVSPSSSRFDFFGLGTDAALWHFSWTESDNYSVLSSLGGKFESVPAVVATASGRFDIVAVGTDDKLKHGVFTGSGSSINWEDLNVFSNSAPLLVSLTSTKIGIFVVGENNDMLYSTWTVTDDSTWAGKISNFTSTGGNLTASWLIT